MFNSENKCAEKAMLRSNKVLNQIVSTNHVKGNQPLVSSRISRGVAVLTFNNPPANSFVPQLNEDLAKCHEQALADPNVKAVVITGGIKGFFMAGADIPYIGKLMDERNVNEFGNFLRSGHNTVGKIENCSKPSVAAVNGIALGGGCEVAISCNARVALKTARFGLPELTLGLFPGLGGTQRLPRLIGVSKAVDYTLAAKQIPAPKALSLGLVDEIVEDPNLLIDKAIDYALGIADGRIPKVIPSETVEKLRNVSSELELLEEVRKKISKNRKMSHLPHPYVYLDCVEIGIKNGGKAGIEAEISKFGQLALTPSSRSLVHNFLSTKQTSKIPGLNIKKAMKGIDIKKVGVLGGGTMGSGIVALYLMRGYEVVLKEINEKFLEGGKQRVMKILSKFKKRKHLNEQQFEHLTSKLTCQITYDGFEKLDLVIEAALENIKLKQEIFQDLEKVCNPKCILSTNTSTIDIELVAEPTKAHSRIIGLHFFSPAHVMPLLEIIRTKYTSDSVLAASVAMSKRIGKVGVVVGNCVGFTANRVFFPYSQSAYMLVDHGVDPYRIDKALTKFGMPVGVFMMMDMSGLDVFSHVNSIINTAYGERCYNSTLGSYMVKEGRLGQKTKRGFYDWSKGRPFPDPNGVSDLIKRARGDAGNPSIASQLTDEDIVQLVLFPVANECFRVIEEGYVLRESDVDMVTEMGYGFPSWRGGVLFWAREVGLNKIYQKMIEFPDKIGTNPLLRSFFYPCKLLQKEAKSM